MISCKFYFLTFFISFKQIPIFLHNIHPLSFEPLTINTTALLAFIDCYLVYIEILFLTHQAMARRISLL